MEERIKKGEFSFPDKNVSDKLHHFIKSLIHVSVESRLGTKNGEDELKSHPWLSKVNFDKLLNKVFKSPFRPSLSNELDTKYFDLSYMKNLSKKSVEEDYVLCEGA